MVGNNDDVNVEAPRLASGLGGSQATQQATLPSMLDVTKGEHRDFIVPQLKDEGHVVGRRLIATGHTLDGRCGGPKLAPGDLRPTLRLRLANHRSLHRHVVGAQ